MSSHKYRLQNPFWGNHQAGSGSEVTRRLSLQLQVNRQQVILDYLC